MDKRPRILIIGNGRHGKDTVAEMLRDTYGLKFESSSEFVGRHALWKAWGEERYPTFEAMYEDRHNFRSLWKNLIEAYNTPDATKTSRGMLDDNGLDMYVGMRSRMEFEASKHLYDIIVWVDRSDVLPPEDFSSMELSSDDADWFLDNNLGLEELEGSVYYLFEELEARGFSWAKPLEEYSKVASQYRAMPKVEEPEQVDLMETPEGAISVLDHGYIKLVDVMGTDADVAAAARLSYGRGTKKVNKDEGLIRYLYNNHHTSPFEMCEIKVQMRLPIFVMRQLVRQRTANLNEYSGRYSEMPRLFYIPDVHQIRVQHATNKQGSGEPIDLEDAKLIQMIMKDSCNRSFDAYEKLLEAKVARETAREVLPLNTYTECVWKLDLNNLFKFLWLRDDSHAQYEIRVYAEVIARFVEENFPLSYAAYKRKRESVTLNQDQLHAIMTGDYSTLPKGEAATVKKVLLDHNQFMNKLTFDTMADEHDQKLAQSGPVQVAP